MAKEETAEMNFKDGTVFLDDLMKLDGSDEAFAGEPGKAPIKFRVTKIAEHCKKFLTELKIFPKNYKEFFSSDQIAEAHKTDQGYKTLDEYERLITYIHDKPFLLRPSDE